MIVYNIRANGPYEYDKFVLNFGQLHNLYADTKEAWENNNVKEQDADLTKKIIMITDPDYILNRLTIIKGLVTE